MAGGNDSEGHDLVTEGMASKGAVVVLASV